MDERDANEIQVAPEVLGQTPLILDYAMKLNNVPSQMRKKAEEMVSANSKNPAIIKHLAMASDWLTKSPPLEWKTVYRTVELDVDAPIESVYLGDAMNTDLRLRQIHKTNAMGLWPYNLSLHEQNANLPWATNSIPDGYGMVASNGIGNVPLYVRPWMNFDFPVASVLLKHTGEAPELTENAKLIQNMFTVGALDTTVARTLRAFDRTVANWDIREWFQLFANGSPMTINTAAPLTKLLLLEAAIRGAPGNEGAIWSDCAHAHDKEAWDIPSITNWGATPLEDCSTKLFPFSDTPVAPNDEDGAGACEIVPIRMVSWEGFRRLYTAPKSTITDWNMQHWGEEVAIVPLDDTLAGLLNAGDPAAYFFLLSFVEYPFRLHGVRSTTIQLKRYPVFIPGGDDTTPETRSTPIVTWSLPVQELVHIPGPQRILLVDVRDKKSPAKDFAGGGWTSSPTSITIPVVTGMAGTKILFGNCELLHDDKIQAISFDIQGADISTNQAGIGGLFYALTSRNAGNNDHDGAWNSQLAGSYLQNAIGIWRQYTTESALRDAMMAMVELTRTYHTETPTLHLPLGRKIERDDPDSMLQILFKPSFGNMHPRDISSNAGYNPLNWVCTAPFLTASPSCFHQIFGVNVGYMPQTGWATGMQLSGTTTTCAAPLSHVVMNPFFKYSQNIYNASAKWSRHVTTLTIPDLDWRSILGAKLGVYKIVAAEDYAWPLSKTSPFAWRAARAANHIARVTDIISQQLLGWEDLTVWAQPERNVYDNLEDVAGAGQVIRNLVNAVVNTTIKSWRINNIWTSSRGLAATQFPGPSVTIPTVMVPNRGITPLSFTLSTMNEDFFVEWTDPYVFSTKHMPWQRVPAEYFPGVSEDLVTVSSITSDLLEAVIHRDHPPAARLPSAKRFMRLAGAKLKQSDGRALQRLISKMPTIYPSFYTSNDAPGYNSMYYTMTPSFPTLSAAALIMLTSLSARPVELPAWANELESIRPLMIVPASSPDDSSLPLLLYKRTALGDAPVFNSTNPSMLIPVNAVYTPPMAFTDTGVPCNLTMFGDTFRMLHDIAVARTGLLVYKLLFTAKDDVMGQLFSQEDILSFL